MLPRPGYNVTLCLRLISWQLIRWGPRRSRSCPGSGWGGLGAPLDTRMDYVHIPLSVGSLGDSPGRQHQLARCPATYRHENVTVGMCVSNRANPRYQADLTKNIFFSNCGCEPSLFSGASFGLEKISRFEISGSRLR